MTLIRKLTITAALATALSAFAQAPAANPSDWMAKMDQQMNAMSEMHKKMAGASTAKERHALMTEQMKLMQGGMGMMGGMAGEPGAMGPMGGKAGMGAMGGKSGMGAMQGGAAAPADMAMRQQMLEKRMEMMQHMMQSMMDQMAPAPSKK